MEILPIEVVARILPYLGTKELVALYPKYSTLIETPYMLSLLCSTNNLNPCDTAVEYASNLSIIADNSKYECMGISDRLLRCVQVGSVVAFKKVMSIGVILTDRIVLAMGRKHPLFINECPKNAYMMDRYQIGTISSDGFRDENMDYVKYLPVHVRLVANEAALSGRLDMLIDVFARTGNVFHDSSALAYECLCMALSKDQQEVIIYLFGKLSLTTCINATCRYHSLWAIKYLNSIKDFSVLIKWQHISSILEDLDIALYLDAKYKSIQWNMVRNSSREDAKLLEYALMKAPHMNKQHLHIMLMECGSRGYLSSFIVLHKYMRLNPRTTIAIIEPLVILEAGMYTHAFLWLQLQVNELNHLHA